MFASVLFTGLQNGVVSAAAAYARSLVFEMAAVWAFPALVGIDGIWWAVNVSEVLTLLFCAFHLVRFAPPSWSANKILPYRKIVVFLHFENRNSVKI